MEVLNRKHLADLRTCLEEIKIVTGDASKDWEFKWMNSPHTYEDAAKYLIAKSAEVRLEKPKGF